MFSLGKEKPSKREKLMEELIASYQKRIDVLEKRPEHVPCYVPKETDMPEYWTKLAELIENDFFVYYFARLRLSIVNQFENGGKDMAEYYRGKLAALGEIMTDARMARTQLNSTAETVK